MAIPGVTWQDVQQAPEDGQRYEAIGGDVYVTPAPRRRHQEVSANLFIALRHLVHEPGHGLVYPAPFGVEFPATGEGVQPDIVVVSTVRREIIGEDWIRGAPDLVVEILSPSTAERDRTLKRRLYQRQGVAEYWIVDTYGESIESWRFGEDPPRREVRRGSITVHLAGEVVGAIALADVYRTDF